MQSQKENKRYRYLLRPEKIKELKYQIQRELPGRNKYSIFEIQYILRSQGLHLQETQITKLSQRLYNKVEDFFTLDQVIGIYGRLNIDQQVEADFRSIFQFFAGSEQHLTAQKIKTGLSRLGETMKDKDVNQIFLDLDLNFNGFINFQIFLESMLRQ